MCLYYVRASVSLSTALMYLVDMSSQRNCSFINQLVVLVSFWQCASLGDASSALRVSADVAEAVPYAVAAVVAVAFVALLIYRAQIGLFDGIGGDKDPNTLTCSSTPYVAAPIYGETGPLVSGSGQGNNVWLAPVD